MTFPSIRRGDSRNCCVLCCVRQLCTRIHAHSSVSDSYITIFPCRRRRVFTLTTLCYCAISSAVARRLCLSHKSQFCQTAGRIEPVLARRLPSTQGQSIISCSPSRRRRQAGPRNKPWAPEWRIVYIYEQVCIYLRRLEYESISFLTL